MAFDLLLLPLFGPAKGLMWIAQKIQETAELELNDKENLQKQLLSLQLSFDLGDIEEEEFEKLEEELLLKIQELEEEEQEEEEEDEE